MIGRLREWAYRRRVLRPVELPAFTVSVGNLSLGGTGKSAFVMELCEWAVARRIPAAVLSRGYKRKATAVKVVRALAPLPAADELGDEPWMIRHRVPGVALLVHANRAVKALRHWRELGEPRLVILDDAFQHWRCARDLDVLMVDATESLEQRALPFGRLRETVEAVRRADLVVLTRAGVVDEDRLTRLERRLREASVPRHQPTWKRATYPELRVIAGDYIADGFRDAAGGSEAVPDPGREYLLVSGIAKPDHLRRVVREAGVNVVEELYFPDHHRLTDRDTAQIRRSLANLRQGSLLITEKDWGRWRHLFAPGGVPGLVFRVRFAWQGEGPAVLASCLAGIAKGAGCSTLP